MKLVVCEHGTASVKMIAAVVTAEKEMAKWKVMVIAYYVEIDDDTKAGPDCDTLVQEM